MTAPSGLVVLDTSIVLYLTRGNDHGQRIDAKYNLRTRPDRPMISIVTLGELLGFATYRGWGQARIDELEDIVRELIVVDINEAIVKKYALFYDFLLKNGRKVGQNDIWIAATAAATSATLITTDADFEPLDGEHLQLSRFVLDPK
jgi:tRNA(fMet)-specific endonuclease VapC